MERIMKSLVKSSYITSSILILLGLVLVVKSEETLKVISYLVGGVLITLGIVAFIKFFKNSEKNIPDNFDIIYGIVTIVFGIFIIINPKLVASIIPFVLGAWILFKSAFKVAYGFELKGKNNPIWKTTLITSGISALVGIIILFNPFKTASIVFMLIGIALIAYGIMDIISTYQLKKNVADFNSKVEPIVEADRTLETVEKSETVVDADIEEVTDNNQEEQLIFDLDGKKFLLYINNLKTSWSNATNSHVALLMVDVTLRENMNSLKREFFANASHELKSPLTSIIGYQQLIQQGILTTKEEIQDATLRTIKEAQRMNKLIIEMLDLSRLENSVQTILEDVNVSKIINDCLLELKPSIENKNIEVITNLDELNLVASQSDLYKLIKNLVDNAIVYNNENGKLLIELKKNKLTISDTGVGISKEDLEHIFDRFYRVDKARSKESSGTGLGLSIVKHICLLYGYKINVESQIGKGTTFTISFY